MCVEDQIQNYINTQSQIKSIELQILHIRILSLSPDCKLWYLSGIDNQGKIVSNPNIGYGIQMKKYANGMNKEFYRIGLSANTSGISIYILGILDKNYLIQKYSKTIGKASITGYCIKFKTLQNINLDVLEDAIKYGFQLI